MLYVSLWSEPWSSIVEFRYRKCKNRSFGVFLSCSCCSIPGVLSMKLKMLKFRFTYDTTEKK